MRSFIVFIMLMLVSVLMNSQTQMYINKLSGEIDSVRIDSIKSISFKTYQSIPKDSMVAYFPFNGNANDSSLNGNNGVLHSAVFTKDRFGKDGKAILFNGNAYVEIPNSTSLQSPKAKVSISAWVMDDYTINKSNTSSDPQYGILGGVSQVSFRAKQISSYPYFVSQSCSLIVNTWNFIAVVYDNSNVTFYVNGVVVGKIPLTGTPSEDSMSLTMGIDTPGATEYVTGSLDDVRIYNRVLSEIEVQTLYHEGGWK